MKFEKGDVVYVENLSLAWGYYTGVLEVVDSHPDGHGVTMLTLGKDGYALTSGVSADRVTRRDNVELED